MTFCEIVSGLRQAFDIDVVRRSSRIPHTELSCRPREKRCSTRRIAACLVREPDSKLSQRTPQRPFVAGGTLPPGFENLVRLERLSGVEQPLRVDEQGGRLGLEPRRIEFLERARRPVGQWPSQDVTRATVQWPPAGVPIAPRSAHSSQLSSSVLKVCGASWWG